MIAHQLFHPIVKTYFQVSRMLYSSTDLKILSEVTITSCNIQQITKITMWDNGYSLSSKMYTSRKRESRSSSPGKTPGTKVSLQYRVKVPPGTKAFFVNKKKLNLEKGSHTHNVGSHKSHTKYARMRWMGFKLATSCLARTFLIIDTKKSSRIDLCAPCMLGPGRYSSLRRTEPDQHACGALGVPVNLPCN